MKHYPKEFKESILKKVYNSNKTIHQIAEEEGLPNSTIRSWKRRQEGESMSQKKPASKLSLKEKFEIVLKVQSLKKTELSEFLRKKGLYSHQLQKFQLEIAEVLQNPRKIKECQDKEIKDLKKELHRKEKALVEASALLLLKKKLEDYYLEDEEKSTN